jgi:hypothetical protein
MPVARTQAGVDDQGRAVSDDHADVGDQRDAAVGDDEDAVGDLFGLCADDRRSGCGSYRITRNPPRMNGCTRQK